MAYNIEKKFPFVREVREEFISREAQQLSREAFRKRILGTAMKVTGAVIVAIGIIVSPFIFRDEDG